MKRFFFLLSLLISVSIGQMLADEVVYKQTIFNSTNNSKGVQNYTSSWSNTTDGFTVDITNANNNNNGWSYIKIGQKNSASTGTIVTNGAIDKAVTKVDLTIDAITAANVTSITLYTSANKSNWSSAGTFDKSTGTKSVSLTTPTANLYYKIEVVCTAKSNGLISISKVEFYAEQSDTPTPTPTLSVAPTTIDFGTIEQNAVVENKTVEVTFADLSGSVTYSGLSSPFTASGTISATGDKITISANTATAGDYSQTLTVQSAADNKSAEVTVKMKVEEPFEGKKLTFDVSSNPGEWPTTNPTTTTNYIYTLNEVDYTFALNNVKCNSGYLMLTAVAKLGLPAISGYKLVKVEATNSSGCSTSTQVSVSSSDATKTDVTGGAAQTWGTTSTKYTYNLSGTAENTMYYLWIANKNCQLVELTLYYEEAEAPAVETPTISGEQNFTTSTTVTLSCTTEGATIYYTTDNSTPTSSSSAYSDPFQLNATATVKAIAIKGGTSSSVAEMSFSKIVPLTTMDAIFEKATQVSSTATDVYVTFNNWVVTGVKNNNAYVTDGTKGLIIYQSSHGFAVGNILSGTVACKVQLYNGSSELTSLTSTTTGLTVTTGGTVTPVELNASGIAALTGVNTGSVIKISGACTTNNSKYYVAGVQLYNSLYEYDAPTTGKDYNCTGVYLYYKNGNNAAINEILPRSAADIAEIAEEGAPEAPTFNVAAGTYTEVKTVTISTTTEGAAIFYTTDGTTPTNESTLYSSPVEVATSLTLKAIAIKNDKSSTVTSAAYTINLPVDETIAKEWNLSVASYDNDASEDKVTWSGTYVKMVADKDKASTAANNYLGGDANNRTSSRFYKDSKLTFTPTGKQITTITLIATSADYASALAGSTWTNASAQSNEKNVVVTVQSAGDVSAAIGGTCGFTKVRVEYKEIDASAPAKPTFNPAAGTYTAVQNVTISCETEGATIYYTTDGTNPSAESTEYSSAISVGENMTIKAIAIKDSKSSAVETAVYEINLPIDENTAKEWDLSVASYDNDASEDKVTWSGTYVKMVADKDKASTAANNYLGGDANKRTSSRFYKDSKLTFTPTGKQITTITLIATSADYASALAGSTWTNASAQSNDKNVVVTVQSKGEVSATIGGTCGFTKVRVDYKEIDASVPSTPTFSPEAGTYTAAQSVEISCTTEGATIYYTTNGTNPTAESTEYSSAISVDESMTIKAIAIKDDKSSAVATAAYTINLPLSSMDAIFAAATAASSTATDINIAFGNWVISGVSTNGKNVYLTDGTNGLIIFDNGASIGFEVGDILSGTVACKVQLYKGAAELTTLSSESEGLSIAKGGVITPAVKAISDLSGINTGAPVIINSVQFDGTNLSDGTNSIKPFNSLFAYDALEEGKYYNVTGIYLQFESTKEILPRGTADIEELPLADPELSYSPESQIIEVGDAWTAPTFANPHILSVSFESNNESVATVSNTGVVELAGGTGTAVITASFVGNATYAAGNATYTITVNPAGSTDNVVVLVQFNDGTEDKWLAMKHDLTAVEVNYSDGKIHNLSSEDQAAITWKRSVDNESNVTFQDPSNDDYLKGSNSTTLSVAAGKSGSYQWTWNETYYRVGTQTRTFLYQGNSAKFKNFAAGNAGKTTDGGYSQLPVVINPVFVNDDPEPPTPDYGSYQRPGLTVGYYGTICLPNAGTIANAKLFDLEYYDGASTLYLLEVNGNAMEAGHPYVFLPSATSIEVTYTDNAGASAGSFNGLVGSYTQETITADAGNYILYNNMYYLVNSTAYVGANRAYIHMAGVPTEPSTPQVGQAPRRRVAMNVNGRQVATGISDIETGEQPMKVMMDGKLYIIRAGQLYDMTGRKVK